MNRSSTSTPTSPTSAAAATPVPPASPVPSLIGTWKSAAAVGSPGATSVGSCSDFVWTVTTQTATDVSGSFSGTCLGSASITGTGTGHIDGSSVTININGNGSMSGLPSCPFSIGGTGTISGETIAVPYNGSTCLGPLSGTQTLQRSLLQPAPVAPALRDPVDGATVSSRRPTLTVNNATPRVPGDSMQYFFEVATDAGFSNRIFTPTVNETGGSTSYSIPNDLAYGTRYYWHVKSVEAGRSSGFSNSQSFVTLAAPAPTPAPTPDPAPNGSLDMRMAVVKNSPLDLANWAVTTSISVLDIRSSGVHVEFSKQNGGDRWPDVMPPGWSGPLQYTLGMCLRIGGTWYCSAVVEFWHGLDEGGGPPTQFAENWFYDSARWAPMTGHQPAPGETIGFFVCAGDCRNNTSGSLSPVKERSNVVLVAMPGGGGPRYTL